MAGKRLSGSRRGEWLRPVGASPTEELARAERYVGGREPRLLDILEVPFTRRVPHGCQRENCRVAPGIPWKCVGRLGPAEASELCDPAGPLWVNGAHAHNDRMPMALADAQPCSLRLVRVLDPVWSVKTYGGKPRPRLVFQHADEIYDLAVTDPVAAEELHPGASTAVVLTGEYLLTISLGEPFHGDRFKLVAGIIRM